MSAEDTMEALLSDATACIVRECAAAYRAMREVFDDRRVLLQIGDERFEWSLLEPDSEGPWREPIHVRTTPRVLRDVLLGELDSLDAVTSDALHVRGAPADIGALGAVGLAFLKGTARSPSTWSFTERLNRIVRSGGGKDHD